MIEFTDSMLVLCLRALCAAWMDCDVMDDMFTADAVLFSETYTETDTDLHFLELARMAWPDARVAGVWRFPSFQPLRDQTREWCF